MNILNDRILDILEQPIRQTGREALIYVKLRQLQTCHFDPSYTQSVLLSNGNIQCEVLHQVNISAVGH